MNNLDKYTIYIKRYIPYYLCILLFATLHSIGSLLRTYFLSLIIDDVLEQSNFALLKLILFVLIMIMILQALISYVTGYLNTYVTQKVSLTLREKIIAKLGHVNLKYINVNKNDNFIVLLTQDVEAISNSLCNYFIAFISALFTAIITMIYIFYLNSVLALISLAVIFIQIIASTRFARHTQKNQSDILLTETIHMSIVHQLVGGIRYIRSYHTETGKNLDYARISNEMARLGFVAYLISYIYSNVSMILSYLGSMLIFTVGVVFVFQNKMTIGTLFVFDSIAEILYGNISSMVSLIMAFMRASVSFGRMDQLFNAEEEECGNQTLTEPIQNILFEKVDFGYDKDNDNIDVLKNFNLELRRGETCAVIGRSGMGKSTLINLLMRFYKTDSGEIFINNIKLKDIILPQIREKIIVVYQENFIINDTVRENIVFGHNVDENRFNEIAKLCHIDDFVENLPEQYNTIIQEGGVNFSGGEKQRIAIARALLRDADVYIFDEAFSQIDMNLELQMVSAIRERLSDKIVIFITHDLNIIKDISHIVLFEGTGEIHEGDNDSLIKKSGFYNKLIRGEIVNES